MTCDGVLHRASRHEELYMVRLAELQGPIETLRGHPVSTGGDNAESVGVERGEVDIGVINRHQRTRLMIDGRPPEEKRRSEDGDAA